MSNKRLFIETTGMRQMENDFSVRSVDEGIAAGHERLATIAELGENVLRASIPVGEGDYRRPAGTLAASARHVTATKGDDWEVVYMVGTNDDEVPYAKWVLYKNIRKPDGDYLQPMDDFLDEAGPKAMDTAFDVMFGEE